MDTPTKREALIQKREVIDSILRLFENVNADNYDWYEADVQNDVRRYIDSIKCYRAAQKKGV